MLFNFLTDNLKDIQETILNLELQLALDHPGVAFQTFRYI